MGEIEAFRARLSGIGGRRERRREGEGIGNGKAVLCDDIAPGGEVPPRIGVGQFGGEQAEEKERSQPDERRNQPCRA